MEFHSSIPSVSNLSALYESQTKDWAPVLPGSWKFLAGELEVRVRLSTASIWRTGEGPGDNIDADIGGWVSGPYVDFPRAKEALVKAPTNRAFASYGLPAPTYDGLNLDDWGTCYRPK